MYGEKSSAVIFCRVTAYGVKLTVRKDVKAWSLLFCYIIISREERGEFLQMDYLNAVVMLMPGYVGSDFILIFQCTSSGRRSCTRMDMSPRKRISYSVSALYTRQITYGHERKRLICPYSSMDFSIELLKYVFFYFQSRGAFTYCHTAS